MMDLEKLHGIVSRATVVYRKGAEVVERGNVVEVFGYPHRDEAPADVVVHDLHFVDVGVDPEEAEEVRDEFVEVLRTYPEPERLKEGPSYIESGIHMGSQEIVLRVYALGQHLGLWEVITPRSLLPGIDDETADVMAGQGMVMMSGFRE